MLAMATLADIILREHEECHGSEIIAAQVIRRFCHSASATKDVDHRLACRPFVS